MAAKQKKPALETEEPNYSGPSAAVMQMMGVEPHEWDVLLVGDGSGTTWNNPCGWASVLIDRNLGLRKTMIGAMNAGTSYLAELIPYVQALSWYIEGPGKARLLDLRMVNPTAKLKVHVITDNQTLATQGQGRMSRRKGFCYWRLIEAFEEEGYAVYWHWLGRSTIALNCLCDYLAGECRRGLTAIGPVEVPKPTTAYDYNSDEQKPETPVNGDAPAPGVAP